MPALIAFATGVVNELELISVVAMPAAFADTAALICATICEATEFVEPVHFGTGMSRIAAASAKPYWVGVKKVFVVTWLTNQNCHAGTFGKFPAVSLAAAFAGLLDELHAASSAEAAAVALTRPVPLSSFRRDGPSFMLRVSIASSTLGSTLSITGLHHFLVAAGMRRRFAPGGHHAPRSLCLLSSPEIPVRRGSCHRRNGRRRSDPGGSRRRPCPPDSSSQGRSRAERHGFGGRVVSADVSANIRDAAAPDEAIS